MAAALNHDAHGDATFRAAARFYDDLSTPVFSDWFVHRTLSTHCYELGREEQAELWDKAAKAVEQRKGER